MKGVPAVLTGSMLAFPFKCPFCQGITYRISEIRASEGGWTAMFDWDTAAFTAITCASCQHVSLFNMYVDEFKAKYNKPDA